jgi:HEAT repeat protein
MRVSVLVISCLVLLLVLFIASLVFLGRDPSDLPGADFSHVQLSAVPGHIEALRSQDASTRRKAATTLWQMGVAAKGATPTLLQVAKDPDPQVREAAVKALGRTGEGTQDALPVLIEALQDEHAAVRAAAATSLAETWRGAAHGRREAGREPAGPAAEGRSSSRGDPRPLVRLTPSYEALARKAVPLLAAALRDPDTRVRARAAEALAETGPLAEPAVGDLVHLLQEDADSNTRLQATLALANIGPGAKAAVPVLVEKLRGEKADGVRVNTAVALGLIRSSPETVVPALVETFLKDEHPDARGAAMRSIGRFGPEAKIAIPLLRAAAQDPTNQQSAGTMQNIDRLLKFLGREAPASAGGRAGDVPPSEKGASPK